MNAESKVNAQATVICPTCARDVAITRTAYVDLVGNYRPCISTRRHKVDGAVCAGGVISVELKINR